MLLWIFQKVDDIYILYDSIMSLTVIQMEKPFLFDSLWVVTWMMKIKMKVQGIKHAEFVLFSLHNRARLKTYE